MTAPASIPTEPPIPLRTKFPGSVRPVPASPVKSTGLFVLKDAGGNTKLTGPTGRNTIAKGPFQGLRLYTLTLEERVTCPLDCQNLRRCYGNTTPFAHRYEHGPALEAAITADIATLTARYGAFVVRLHILGDFYSVAYVDHWRQLTAETPGLHVFGYTHWRVGTPIGAALTDWVRAYPARVRLLRSDWDEPGDPLPKAYTVDRGADAVAGSLPCPEQVFGVPCTECGLCMNGHTSVTFFDHSR